MATKESADWAFRHNELMGMLANSTESLTSINVGAPLDRITECLNELQNEIETADEAALEQEDDEEEEQEEDEDEDE